MRDQTPTHGIVTTDGDTFDDNRPVLVQVYPSERAVEKALSANRDEYPGATVMSLEAFDERKRAFHLDDPGDLTPCDRDEYYRMRDCVPPEHFARTDSFGRFIVGEPYTGTIRRQYVRLDTDTRTLYAWRHVDAEDPGTWITREETLNFAKADPATYTRPDAAASGPAIRSQFGGHA